MSTYFLFCGFLFFFFFSLFFGQESYWSFPHFGFCSFWFFFLHHIGFGLMNVLPLKLLWHSNLPHSHHCPIMVVISAMVLIIGGADRVVEPGFWDGWRWLWWFKAMVGEWHNGGGNDDSKRWLNGTTMAAMMVWGGGCDLGNGSSGFSFQISFEIQLVRDWLDITRSLLLLWLSLVPTKLVITALVWFDDWNSLFVFALFLYISIVLGLDDNNYDGVFLEKVS